MLAVLRRLAAYKPLHFVLGGYLLYRVIDPGATIEVVEPLAIGEQTREQLRASWTASVGRAPTDAELQALVRRELDDEILVREALQHGLHERDAVIRQRLALNMRFLDPKAEGSDEVLAAQAIRMDMHRNDLVVRRRLVQLMEFALSDDPQASPVSQSEREAMYAERREELQLPARWRLVHVYFSAERRGGRAQADAAAAVEALLREGASPAAAAGQGDPFLGGRELPLLGAAQLTGQFGEGFVQGLAGCEVGRWCGPVASSFGFHAVRVEDYQPPRLPGIDEPEVRKRLEADVRRAREQRRLAEAMAGLRRKYGVEA